MDFIQSSAENDAFGSASSAAAGGQIVIVITSLALALVAGPGRP